MTPYLTLREFPADSLPGVLEPYLWVQAVSVDQVRSRRAVYQLERVEGIVKGPETVGDTGADLDKLIGPDHQRLIDGLARATREAMYRAAEDAITAAAAAGYRLAQHPEIEVRGRINTDHDTGLEVPCAECHARLSFFVPLGRQA